MPKYTATVDAWAEHLVPPGETALVLSFGGRKVGKVTLIVRPASWLTKLLWPLLRMESYATWEVLPDGG